MPSQQPTHHGYAVNVKDHGRYDSFDPLPEADVQELYDEFQQCFWDDAAFLAQEHGFKTVYSEGRMAGWCVPQPQPATDDMPESEVEAWEREKFAPFAEAITDLVAQYRADFAAEVEQATAAWIERREACIVRGEN